MAQKDFYPEGAYSDTNAPFNEPVICERDFDIDVEFVMHKTVTVKTNDYVPEYDDEDGRECANTENTDWGDAYDNSGHYSIQEMLEELKQYVIEDMKTCSNNTCRYASLKRLLESCEGWETVESTFEY